MTHTGAGLGIVWDSPSPIGQERSDVGWLILCGMRRIEWIVLETWLILISFEKGTIFHVSRGVELAGTRRLSVVIGHVVGLVRDLILSSVRCGFGAVLYCRKV